MKSTFDDLKAWLLCRKEMFVCENMDGSVDFDMEALLSEITAFAEEFERQIQ